MYTKIFYLKISYILISSVMRTVNIVNLDDPFYRYKRPYAISEYHGNKTTIIVNLEEIANALHTKASYILYYIQLAKSTSVNDKGEIKMIIPLKEIEKIINKFINEYIICTSCKLPELVIKKMDGQLEFSCEACGHTKPLIKNKFTKIIYKDWGI